MLRQIAPGQSEWLPGVCRNTIGSTFVIRLLPSPSFPGNLKALTEQALPECEDAVDEGFQNEGSVVDYDFRPMGMPVSGAGWGTG